MRLMEFKMERENLVKEGDEVTITEGVRQVLIIIPSIRQWPCPVIMYSGKGLSPAKAL